jgi:4-carboxymuconolactone decarboxylase
MPKSPRRSSVKKASAKPAPQHRSRGRKPRVAGASSGQSPRLPELSLDALSPEQAAIVKSITAGPRGNFVMEGPFAVYLHAPGYGQLAQQLGGFVRYQTSVPARLSEFAILFTAHYWKAQYEWFAHATIAERQGVRPETIRALAAGRTPKSAPPDEMAIHAFAKELYATRRVSERTYAKVHNLLGDAGIVELVGILGYYASVAMTLNAFRMPLPAGTVIPFAEPRGT